MKIRYERANKTLSNRDKFRRVGRFVFCGVCLICLGGCSGNDDATIGELQVLEEEWTQEVEYEIEDEVVEWEVEEETFVEDVLEEGTEIAVYVCGAVVTPGVYQLEEGSRIIEAIEQAGGVTDDAMESSLNLAETLEDGQKVYVPTEKEVEEGYLAQTEAEDTSTASSGKVNINTASTEVLMTLSGIGESKAEAIVDYREAYGAFMTIEDLQNVSGIKEGVYSAIADDIEV